MTKEWIEKNLEYLDWQRGQYRCFENVSFLAKTGFDFNLRVIEHIDDDGATLLKENLNGEAIDIMKFSCKEGAYKKAREMQIRRLCEILQITEKKQ
ncbi:hypothetical protein [uncultured Porphyromonas sp.]|uniref:hypothetical protein n=1 Tax=uncultured Porphyromonas sp. TaxID=159274 RepID=UPI002603D8AE|nr:hypothetical protein [uncultured Porphyromonas sp.]